MSSFGVMEKIIGLSNINLAVPKICFEIYWPLQQPQSDLQAKLNEYDAVAKAAQKGKDRILKEIRGQAGSSSVST